MTIIQKITKIDSFFFSRLTFYINFGIYVVVKFCFSFIIFGYGNVC